MSNDLYNELLDDTQVLINLALKKLNRASEHLKATPKYREKASLLWLDLSSVCQRIDELPGLED